MAGRPQKKRNNKTFIAKRLEELLAGINFAEFERKNQLPVATVRRIMDGNDPRISTLSMIAKACGVTLDYFYEESQKAPPSAAGGVAYVLTATAIEACQELDETQADLNRLRLYLVQGQLSEAVFREVVAAVNGAVGTVLQETTSREQQSNAGA